LFFYHLLPDGRLEEPASHDLKGAITAGPFLRTAEDGTRWLVCVLDGDRLAWLNADKPDKVERFGQRGDQIIGQPELVEGLFVVATASGKFTAVNPETAEPAGPAFALQGSIAPAAAPARFTHAQMLPSSATAAFGLGAMGTLDGLLGSATALTLGGNPSLLFVPLTDGTILLLPLDRLRAAP
jgi:hypothetical protein